MTVSLMFPERDEWNYAWGELAKKELNNNDPVCEHDATGECWQYMGTEKGQHVFRHRCHPATGNREFIDIPVLPGGEHDENTDKA